MKLNLGALDTRIPGFKSVDIVPGKNIDFVCNIENLSRFKDCTVSEIYASHCLEHFSHIKTAKVLKEWYRVLKKGGKISVAVPDFDAIIKIYSKCGVLTDWLGYVLYGDQLGKNRFHYTIFTCGTLFHKLSLAGFKGMKKVDNLGYLNDASMIEDNFFRIPISLNVVAEK